MITTLIARVYVKSDSGYVNNLQISRSARVTTRQALEELMFELAVVAQHEDVDLREVAQRAQGRAWRSTALGARP